MGSIGHAQMVVGPAGTGKVTRAPIPPPRRCHLSFPQARTAHGTFRRRSLLPPWAPPLPRTSPPLSYSHTTSSHRLLTPVPLPPSSPMPAPLSAPLSPRRLVHVLLPAAVALRGEEAHAQGHQPGPRRGGLQLRRGPGHPRPHLPRRRHDRAEVRTERGADLLHGVPRAEPGLAAGEEGRGGMRRGESRGGAGATHPV